MGRAFPAILERFGTYAAYGSASVQEIFGDALKLAQSLRANTLESMVFLNRGDHFEARPLPLMAQLTPAFAPVVADFDGDGNEDIFLSQNCFAVDRETGRYDGGRGLWLRGDGQGNFEACSARRTNWQSEWNRRSVATEVRRTVRSVARTSCRLRLLV